jgi:hypothetical protein
MHIQPGTARVYDLQHAPPLTHKLVQAAGKMLVSPETNVRAFRLEAGITEQCAVQHPGQTEVQTHGTPEASSLMPAVSTSAPIFIGRGARIAWTAEVKRVSW